MEALHTVVIQRQTRPDPPWRGPLASGETGPSIDHGLASSDDRNGICVEGKARRRERLALVVGVVGGGGVGKPLEKRKLASGPPGVGSSHSSGGRERIFPAERQL